MARHRTETGAMLAGMGWTLATLAILSLLACGSDEPSSDKPTAKAPTTLDFDFEKPGPFGVGYRTWKIDYVPPASAASRTITVHVWYPTEETTGEHTKYLATFPDKVSLVDVKPADPVAKAGYPVLIYSHGDRGVAGSSAFLMQYFARHGWIAIAPDHTDNTLIDTKKPLSTGFYIQRPSDISAALDAVATLPASDALAGRSRTDRVVMSGHSFGGYTCWSLSGATFDVEAISKRCKPKPIGSKEACTEAEIAVFTKGLGDDRVVATIPLATSIKRSWFGPTGHESVKVPFLSLTGGNDKVGADKQFATCKGLDLTWVEFAGGCHQTFAMGMCPTLDVEEGFRLTSIYALAFARRHLLGDQSAPVLSLLDGSRLPSDKVTYHKH